MRILDIRDATESIRSAIRNAVIDFSAMTVSAVAVVTDRVSDGRPVVGFGFCSNGRYGQSGILRERFLPRLKAAAPEDLVDETGRNLDPFKVQACFLANEKPGGHGDRAVAAGALDMAIWDAVAKAEGLPLWRLLSRRFNAGEADAKALVYPGGGYYYPGKDLTALKDEMRRYGEQGYRVVKMKIGGAPLDEDRRRIEAVIEVVGEGGKLAVDANGRFDLPQAVACAEAISPYGLFWYEEPLDPLDYQGHAVLAEYYSGALATGENLFSRREALNLLRHAGLRPDRDWIQVDPALAYGLSEYLKVIEMVETHGWSRRRLIPHGGHQLALHAAIGLQLGGAEAYPLVFQPFGGFADDCRIEAGYAHPGERPGLGIEGKAELHAIFRRLMDK